MRVELLVLDRDASCEWTPTRSARVVFALLGMRERANHLAGFDSKVASPVELDGEGLGLVSIVGNVVDDGKWAPRDMISTGMHWPLRGSEGE